MRMLVVAVLGLGVAGCYASHERSPLATGGCGLDRCDETGVATDVTGVCVEAGEVFAFTDGASDVSCVGVDGDATRFGRLLACPGTDRRARRVACCAPSDEAFITRWVFEGGVLGTSVDLDESDDGCALAPDDPYPVGPFAPWAPAELCDDPLGWSGVPLVFSFRTPGADPCADGSSRHERCSARIEGARIVVELQIAPAERGVCEPALSDDAASCAVLPLAAGAYDVVDGGGRALGRLVVPGAPPASRDAICVPIGS